MRQLLSLAALVAVGLVGVYADDEKPADTPKAAKMRKLLKAKKITVSWKDIRLEEALDEIKEDEKGFKYLMDTKGGVSRNQPITYSGKDKTIEEVLDGMLKKADLGYIVISKKGDPYDGLVQIRKGKERGYPKKK
jgi:hypothetical protein